MPVIKQTRGVVALISFSIIEVASSSTPPLSHATKETARHLMLMGYVKRQTQRAPARRALPRGSSVEDVGTTSAPRALLHPRRLKAPAETAGVVTPSGHTKQVFSRDTFATTNNEKRKTSFSCDVSVKKVKGTFKLLFTLISLNIMNLLTLPMPSSEHISDFKLS